MEGDVRVDFLTLAKERYSCRKFTEQPVEREKIDRIIEAAIAAPSAAKKYPVRCWLVESPEGLRKINTVTKFTFGASVVIVVGGKPSDAWVRDEDNKNFAEVDAAIVGTHIMLAVHAEGLRSTWVGRIDIPKLRDIFPETADYEIVGLFPIGYPADEGKPAKGHFQRKTREEFVTEI